MKMNLHRIALAGALITLIPLSALARDGLTMTTGVDYSSGKYGGTQSTDITYIPIIAKYQTGRWTLKLTLPWISITGPGNVVPNVGTVGTSAGTRTTQSGLGDVVASASRTVYFSRTTQTLIDVTGKVKFATADEKKGLGTGKNDYAAQVDVYKLMGKLTPFATVGYKVLGNPSGYTLHNVWYGTLGSAYKLTPQTTGGLMLDLRQKSSAAGAPHRDVTAFVSHKLGAQWKLQGYVIKGFANGSPDWETGAMIAYHY